MSVFVSRCSKRTPGFTLPKTNMREVDGFVQIPQQKCYENPQDQRDWYIYIHLLDLYGINVGIHIPWVLGRGHTQHIPYIDPMDVIHKAITELNHSLI